MQTGFGLREEVRNAGAMTSEEAQKKSYRVRGQPDLTEQKTLIKIKPP